MVTMERNFYVVALILLIFYTGQSKRLLFLFHGCYTGFDSDKSFSSNYMSIEMCSKFCDERHYTWIATSGQMDGGVMDSHSVATCSCSKQPAHTEINGTLCNYPCPGNENETCGGQNTTFVSMYSIVADDSNATVNITVVAAVAGSILVVMVIIITVTIIIYKRFHKRKFDPIPSHEALKSEEMKGTTKDVFKTGQKSKPNHYEQTKQSSCIIDEEKPLNTSTIYQNETDRVRSDNTHDEEYMPMEGESNIHDDINVGPQMEYVAMADDQTGKHTGTLYSNEGQKEYEDVNIKQRVINSTDKSGNKESGVYQNVQELEVLGYEKPVEHPGQTHLYLKLEDEKNESGEEYEEVVPTIKPKKGKKK